MIYADGGENMKLIRRQVNLMKCLNENPKASILVSPVFFPKPLHFLYFCDFHHAYIMPDMATGTFATLHLSEDCPDKCPAFPLFCFIFPFIKIDFKCV